MKNHNFFCVIDIRVKLTVAKIMEDNIIQRMIYAFV